ncbi:MAG: hypothetical protein BGO52_12395 [Sphingobacteriales bacterium 44-61]|nr:MAG: hypothetical protein BGO52_12395 [Sphingobacteriales bacterium 44-61]
MSNQFIDDLNKIAEAFLTLPSITPCSGRPAFNIPDKFFTVKKSYPDNIFSLVYSESKKQNLPVW